MVGGLCWPSTVNTNWKRGCPSEQPLEGYCGGRTILVRVRRLAERRAAFFATFFLVPFFAARFFAPFFAPFFLELFFLRVAMG